MVLRIAASGGTLIRPVPPQWAQAARPAPTRRPAWPAGGVVVGLPQRAAWLEPAPLGDSAFITAGNALAAQPSGGITLFAAEDVAPDSLAEAGLPPGLLALLLPRG